MNELTNILQDIARVPAALRTPAGPNTWDSITPSDFGPEEDFRLEDRGNTTTINAVSNAALQWLYKHLPEDCPRHGKGFIIENQFLPPIVRHMKRDGLMDEEDYFNAMEESHRQNHQWDFAEYQVEDWS